MALELEEARCKAWRRSVGNMKFIGELFKLNIITVSIMNGCIQKLLRNGDEESLACLTTLLSTTGKHLDNKDAKVSADMHRGRRMSWASPHCQGSSRFCHTVPTITHCRAMAVNHVKLIF